MRIGVLGLALCLSGCAHDRPITVVRLPAPVVRCPSDNQLKDMAIKISIATYRQAPGGSRSCACPGDTYIRGGQETPCSAPGAIHPATWVFCREDVPPDLIRQMRTGCRS